MSPASLPRMFVSENEGWEDISRRHPSVRKLFVSLVVPLSLIPPLMYIFAQLAYPGEIFPIARPAPTALKLILNGAAFFVIELAMVSFMATLIRQLADGTQTRRLPYENAYALAAVAPIPLWLAPLALFIPSLGFAALVLLIAWFGSIALIRHGVRPLTGIEDEDQAKRVANMIILSGVVAWLALLVLAAGLLSLFLVWSH